MTEIDVLLISSSALILWLLSLRRKAHLYAEPRRRKTKG